MRLIAMLYIAGFCGYPFAQILLDKDVHILIVAALCFIFGLAVAVATME